jgi:hypothetical protein
MPNGAEGAFDTWSLACVPSSFVKLSSHHRYECEQTLDGGGTRTLGFDDLIRDLRCSSLAFDVSLRESVALTFKGQGID